MNAIALACLVWTVAAYWLAKKAYARKQVVWRSPALTVPVLTIALMLALGISYEQYQTYTHWIVALLGPATVAFAIPIYQYRAVIRRQMVILGAAVVVGMVVGVGSAFVLAHLFHFNEEVTNSLMARSISMLSASEVTRVISSMTASCDGDSFLPVMMAGLAK